jgi:hypothetical protein
MLTMLVMARVIAETGLIFATVGVWYMRFWAALGSLPLIGAHTSPQNLLWTNWSNHLTIPGLREAPSVYATHALALSDRADPDADLRTPSRRGFVFLLAISLLIGYLAAGASTLFVEYNYASTLGANPQTPLNSSAINGSQFLLQFATQKNPDTLTLGERHSSPLHVAIGAVITAILSFCRLRWDWWPLHPVGYLLYQSYPLAAAWFSIFVGWLAKVLIVKFGGGSLFQQARPFFLGLVIGEAAAAAFWLLVAIVLSASGQMYQPINLLPG